MEPRIQYVKTADGVCIAYGLAMQKMMPKEATNAAS